MRQIYLILGLIFTVIGVIGIVTPLLPSTPFLLLAAGCFARSSDRFHAWLLNHPTLSPPILDWQQNGVIKTRAKILATIFMAINAIVPLFVVPNISHIIKLSVVIVMSCVLIFIWSRPSRPANKNMER